MQDCPIFNDGSFDALRKEGAEERLINVAHGEPITFGADGEYCVVKSGYGLEVAKTADVSADEIVVHNAQIDDPAYAFALSRLSEQNLEHMVMGIFRQVSKPDLRRRGAQSGRIWRVMPSRTTRLHCNRCSAAKTPGPSTNARDVTTPVPLAAVVLAGGASRRMGRDKATLPFEAATLRRAHGVDRAAAVFAGLRDRRAGTTAAHTSSADVLRDDVRGVGPLLATARGLRAAADAGLELAFVCAVDMPLLDVDLIDGSQALRCGSGPMWCCRGTAATTTSPGSTGRRWPAASTNWSQRGSAACALWWTPSTPSGS